MRMLRIAKAEALPGLRLRLTLTDGRVIERDVALLLHGPVFERIRSYPAEFARVRAKGGTVVWPNGADFDPATLHDWPKYANEFAARAAQWARGPAARSETLSH